MKKLFILAVAFGAFSLTSCKKDYTCECTIGGVTVPATYTKVTKKDAKAACDNANTGATASGGSCKLK